MISSEAFMCAVTRLIRIEKHHCLSSCSVPLFLRKLDANYHIAMPTEQINGGRTMPLCVYHDHEYVFSSIVVCLEAIGEFLSASSDQRFFVFCFCFLLLHFWYWAHKKCIWPHNAVIQLYLFIHRMSFVQITAHVCSHIWLKHAAMALAQSKRLPNVVYILWNSLQLGTQAYKSINGSIRHRARSVSAICLHVNMSIFIWPGSAHKLKRWISK